MSRARTTGLLALWLATGCLVDQPIVEDTGQPSRRNHPPVIVMREPSNTTLYLQRSCEKVYFSLPRIDDLDERDELVVKWFVNYEDDPEPVDVWPPIPPSEDGPTRLVTYKFRVSLEDYPDRSTIVVEAVVSDGFADPTVHPPNRAILPGKGSDVAVWTIVISEGSWCNRP